MRFLAILELFKQGLVDLEQATTFGDITVVWLGGAGQEGLDDAPWHADLALVDAYDG